LAKATWFRLLLSCIEPVITLTLLHPVQSTPVQSWTFGPEQVVRIGRAVDNEVVLYSAVVSRHHVELLHDENQWRVRNLGSNGTYLNGQRIQESLLLDGSVIRLARSGPNIKIQIGIEGDAENPAENSDQPNPLISPLFALGPLAMSSAESAQEARAEAGDALPVDMGSSPASFPRMTQIDMPIPQLEIAEQLEATSAIAVASPQAVTSLSVQPKGCDHGRSPTDALICIDCGEPLRVLGQLGPYQILKQLGTGDHTLLGWKGRRTYVLKTYHSMWEGNRQVTQQFRTQIEVLSNLYHPGIPSMVETLEVADRPYLVSEMVYGQSLKSWVQQRGVLALPQLISWGSEIVRILEYLQQQDPPIIHQGVTPDHLIRPIIPQSNHDVMLVNFGQAKAWTPEAKASLGSVAYTAPEQQKGEAVPASDLYGLGTTLIYLLTGKDPDNFYRLANDEFKLSFSGEPNLRPDIIEIIETLTHPNPQERYQSPGMVIEALQRLI
jgi:eukaryotic-like serine/threonine-protein kinase